MAVDDPIPPAGTPVDQKLYNEACHRIMELEVEVETLGNAITLLKGPLVKAHEMIELLKASRANGDVLAELVEKTEKLLRLDGHIQRALGLARMSPSGEIRDQTMAELEQALGDV